MAGHPKGLTFTHTIYRIQYNRERNVLHYRKMLFWIKQRLDNQHVFIVSEDRKTHWLAQVPCPCNMPSTSVPLAHLSSQLPFSR